MAIRRTKEQKLHRLLGEDAQYVPVAAEISKRVADEVARSDRGQVSEAYRRALERTEQEERRRQMSALFGSLPAERRFSLLSEFFPDDEELREAIAAHRNSITQRDTQQAAIHELAEQGERERRVDLARIPADMSVKLGLYYDEPGSRSPKGPDYYHPNWGNRARYLQLSSLGDSNFMVVAQKIGSRGSAVRDKPTPPLANYDIVQLGSTENLAEGAAFSSHVYYESPVAVIDRGEPFEFRQDFNDGRPLDQLILGRLSVNGTNVLGDFLDKPV